MAAARNRLRHGSERATRTSPNSEFAIVARRRVTDHDAVIVGSQLVVHAVGQHLFHDLGPQSAGAVVGESIAVPEHRKGSQALQRTPTSNK